ncbi:MAG: hypothetical protein ACKO5L_11830 [Bacteroidota bacterium]
MKRILLLACISCSLLTSAQYQMDCKVTLGENEIPYRSTISEKASKTTFNMEGMEMIMLNLLDKGTYTLMPQQNMAIKMKQEMFDTLEVCNCTFVKTGNKKTLLGYPCDEYLQKCTSAKGNSEVKAWYTSDLKFNPLLITPLRQYVSTSASRPSGFPLLHEGTLSDGTKVKFEVNSIIKTEVKPSEFIIPEGFMIMEY